MSKLLSMVVAATFALASASAFAASHAGAPMKDEKKGDKMEKKGDKMEKKGAKMEKKGAKMEKKGEGK